MHEDIITARKYEQAAQAMVTAAELFHESIKKLSVLLGMQAENDQRKAIGASMCYDESAFFEVGNR